MGLARIEDCFGGYTILVRMRNYKNLHISMHTDVVVVAVIEVVVGGVVSIRYDLMHSFTRDCVVGNALNIARAQNIARSPSKLRVPLPDVLFWSKDGWDLTIF